MKPKPILPTFLRPLVFCALTGMAPAADLWWSATSGGSWNTLANWSTDGTAYTAASAIPTNADNIHFNLSSITADQLFLLDANRGARTFHFTSPGSITIQGGGGENRTLTLGGDGTLITPETSTIDIAEGAGPVTIGLPSGGTGNGISTRIQASQTWTNHSSSLFTIHNSIQSTATSGIQVITVAGSGDTRLGTTAGIGNGSTGGTVALTKTGAGTLTVHNASNYTGATRIEGGTLVAGVLASGGSASSIGASTSDSANLVFNGGTLFWTGTANTFSDRGFTLESGGGTIRHDTSGITLRFGGIVTGAGSLTKTGAGSLSLSNGGNDYEGKTFVSEGRLSIRSAGALGLEGTAASGTEVSSGAFLDLEPNNTGGTGENTTWNEFLTLHGGTLRNGNRANTWSGNVTLAATSTVATASGTTLTVTGVVDGNGGLVKNETGTLHVTRANTYTGVTTINSGTLRVNVLANGGSASGLGASSAAASNLVFNGGTLFVNDSNNIGTNRGFTLDENGGTIRKDSNIVRFGGIVTGTGELRKTGGGILALSNDGNNFTGRVVVDTGMVEVRSAGALGASGSADNGVLVNTGATLRLDPDGAEGAGANVTWNETVTLNGGTLHNYRRDNTWNGGVILQDDSSISADASTSLTVNSSVTESGGSRSLTKSGAGTVTFTNTHTFTGTTRVTNGVLVAAAGGGFNSSTNLALEGGVFRLGSNEVFNDLATLAFSGGEFDTNDFDETIGGAVQVTADSFITMTGSGVLRLGASSTEIWQGMLLISGWDGLVTGGGDDQIIFGDDSSALTSDQLARILFVDPTGLAPGTYDAIILASGEIVPGALIPEPSSLLLAALAATGIAARRRREA